MIKVRQLVVPFILVAFLVACIIVGLVSHTVAFTGIGIAGFIFVAPIFLVILLRANRAAVQTPTELSGYLMSGKDHVSFLGKVPQAQGKLAIVSGRLQFISKENGILLNLGPNDFAKIVFHLNALDSEAPTAGELIIRIIGIDNKDLAIFSPISLMALSGTQLSAAVSSTASVATAMPAMLEENKAQDQFQAMVDSLRKQFGDKVSKVNADVANLTHLLIIIGIATVSVFATVGIILLVAKLAR